MKRCLPIFAAAVALQFAAAANCPAQEPPGCTARVTAKITRVEKHAFGYRNEVSLTLRASPAKTATASYTLVLRYRDGERTIEEEVPLISPVLNGGPSYDDFLAPSVPRGLVSVEVKDIKCKDVTDVREKYYSGSSEAQEESDKAGAALSLAKQAQTSSMDEAETGWKSTSKENDALLSKGDFDAAKAQVSQAEAGHSSQVLNVLGEMGAAALQGAAAAKQAMPSGQYPAAQAAPGRVSPAAAERTCYENGCAGYSKNPDGSVSLRRCRYVSSSGGRCPPGFH